MDTCHPPGMLYSMEIVTLGQRLFKNRIVVLLFLIACYGAAVVFALLCALRLLMFIPYLMACNFFWALFFGLVGSSVRHKGIVETVSRLRWLLIATATVWLILAFVWSGRSYISPPQTFSASTDELRDTCIVPTLDTPLPPAKSAVWCEAFELAWNRARSGVFKAPLQIKNAQPACDRLNASSASEKNLESESFCALAGFIKDGIADKIGTELRSKFPWVAPPKFDAAGDAVIAYSYLSVNVPFEYPFFDSEAALTFSDAAGQKTPVKSFGIRKQDDYAYNQLRGQTQVLFFTYIKDHHTLDEFAVDLCKYSQPYQIVLAAVKPQPTLTETLARVEELTAKSEEGEYFHSMGPNDVLLVPSHHWDFTHRFKDLEGEVLNKGFEGYKVAQALESIRFKLDRSGAEVSAESKFRVRPIPRLFIFDRPHLIIIKKRGDERPIFVMWVANAELLDKWNR